MGSLRALCLGVACLVAGALAGCFVTSDLVPCGDKLCPVGDMCVVGNHCAHAEDVEACTGHVDGDACSSQFVDGGVCIVGVCISPGCGNGYVEASEMCDDENTEPDDGCSADCRSDERCGNGVLDFREDCEDGNFLSADGCSSRCVREQLAWTLQPRPGPIVGSDVQSLALTYDSTLHRVVALGPNPDAVPMQTWFYDGAAWTAGPPGPPRRASESLAYDPVRQRVVLFGGRESPTDFDETWELDGNQWILIPTTTAPPARSGAAMVFDPVRGALVLFGGYGASFVALADTWTYDGTWTELTTLTASPPGRGDAVAVFDPVRQSVVVLGGYANGDPDVPTEAWALGATTWTLVTSTLPIAAPTAAVYDIARATYVLFGYNQEFEGDGVNWTERLDGPAHNSVVAVYDSERATTVVFNGLQWALSTTWTFVRLARPTALTTPHIVFDTGRHRLILRGKNAGLETWARAADNTWTIVSEWNDVQPPADAALAYNADDGKVYAVGGTASIQTWVLDGSTWQQLAPATSPPLRVSYEIAYDKAHHRLVLFGGRATFAKNETWTFDGTTWQQLQPGIRPDARSDFGMTYDAKTQRIVIAGGTSGQPPYIRDFLDDAWALDASTWTRLPPPPVAWLDPVLVYDEARGQIVLCGEAEVSGGGFASVVEFDGTVWRNSHVTPIIDDPTEVTYDPYERAIVGYGLPTEADNAAVGLLRYSSADEIPESCSGADDLDGDNLVGCADPDCFAYCDPTCPPATSCAAVRPRCGDGTCDPKLETAARCPEDCP